MKRNSKIEPLIVAVVASVLIHVVVIALIVTPMIIRIFAPRSPDPVAEEVEEVEKVVFKFQAVPKKSEPKVMPESRKLAAVVKKEEPKRKRFARTSADQAQGVPTDTNRIGERDTVARSDAEARADALEQAAVKGEKRESEETTNSNQQLGDVNSEAVARKPVEASEPKSLIPPPPKEVVEPKLEAVPKVAKGAEEKEFMDAREKVKIAKRELERSERSSVGEKMKLEKEAEERLKRELAKKEEVRKRQEAERKAEAERERLAAMEKQKAGFKPTVRAAESMGSISRRGKASQNVKATPTGRYMSAVIKKVGEEWYRRCGERADLLVPGSLTMGWFVYADGSVKHLEIKSERNGGMIQRGITIQSIKSAKVPVMPSEVRSELNGDPLYIQINFEF